MKTLHFGASPRVPGARRPLRVLRPRPCTSLALAATLLLALAGGPASAAPPSAKPPVAAAPLLQIGLSADAETTLRWVLQNRDNRGAPFVLIDKRLAHLWAFDAQGKPVGNSPVLLGSARGDHSVPGIGERAIEAILPEERTTPSGRFQAERGRNAGGEEVFWVDYNAAVSMHRVRPINPKERRLQRLASPTPADNRISYGCINVPVKFFDSVVHPLFIKRAGLVYVLPETQPVQALWQRKPVVTAKR